MAIWPPGRRSPDEEGRGPVERTAAASRGPGRRLGRPRLGAGRRRALRGDRARAATVVDVTSREAPTVRDLLELDDPAGRLRAAAGGRSARSPSSRRRRAPATTGRPRLLAPCDLQALKACGVTFARSMVERVIEERAAGDPARAEAIRGAHRRADRRQPCATSCRAARRRRRPRRRCRPRGCGASTSRSASARTPRSSPRASRCPRSAGARWSGCTRSRAGTTPSPRWCWRFEPRAHRRRDASATT